MSSGTWRRRGWKRWNKRRTLRPIQKKPKTNKTTLFVVDKARQIREALGLGVGIGTLVGCIDPLVDVPMDLSTFAAMPVPSPMRPSMICGEF